MQEINSTTTAADVVAFEENATAPVGFRVCSLHWKSRKATDTQPAVAKRPSVSTIVPSISIVVEPAELQSAVQDAVNDLQDSLVRSLVEAGAVNVVFASVNAKSVADYAATVATSKRLNKPAILQWFDASLQETLVQRVTAAIVAAGTQATDVQLTTIVKGVDAYRESFSKLAAPAPALSQSAAEQLLKMAATSSDTDSAVYESIVSKLGLLAKRDDIQLININI